MQKGRGYGVGGRSIQPDPIEYSSTLLRYYDFKIHKSKKK